MKKVQRDSDYLVKEFYVKILSKDNGSRSLDCLDLM